MFEISRGKEVSITVNNTKQTFVVDCFTFACGAGHVVGDVYVMTQGAWQEELAVASRRRVWDAVIAIVLGLSFLGYIIWRV